MKKDRQNFISYAIYQILFDHSDADHLLRQTDICTYLKNEYQIETTRQAISRNIQNLIDMKIDITTTKKGSYLVSRPLENSELRLLIDCVLSSKYITAKHSEELINKLIALGGDNFKNTVKHVYVAKQLNKSENQDLFYNIEVIDDAIEENKKISFNYYKYDKDGNKQLSAKHEASPYQLVFHNQHYYLILRDDNRKSIGFYRMDKIGDIKKLKKDAYPLKDNPEFKNGINFEKFNTAMPYLFNDETTSIKFECDESMSDQLYDWFGNSVTVMKGEKSNKLVCIINTSEEAMLYWALQYNNKIKIVTPKSLQNKMIETLQSTLNLYK